MRRRTVTNPIQLGSICRTIIIVGSLALVALCYVGIKHQMQALGNYQKNLERELDDVRTRNQIVSAHIAELTSTASLRRQMDAGRFTLIQISDRQIVRIGPDSDLLLADPAPSGPLLPVVNEMARF